MIRTFFIAIAAGGLFTFGFMQSQTASAGEHGHEMHKGDHQAMGEGHQGHDKAKATGAEKGFDKKPAVGTKATCPVMGSEFTVSKDTQFSQYKGKYYAFCCPGCKPQFDENPEKYLK